MHQSKPPKERRSKVLPPCRVSEEERETIKAKAKETGLSLSEYQRRACLDGAVITKEPIADTKLVLELIREGRNFNQYQKKLNSTGKDSPDAVKRVSLKIESLLDALIQ